MLTREMTNQLEELMSVNCSKQKFRKFATSVDLKNVDWLDTQKIKLWRLNGAYWENKHDKSVLSIK